MDVFPEPAGRSAVADSFGKRSGVLTIFSSISIDGLPKETIDFSVVLEIIKFKIIEGQDICEKSNMYRIPLNNVRGD